MRAVYTFLTLFLLSQAPAALAACLVTPDSNGHVDIPSPWTLIYESKFKYCTSLKSITFASTVTSIEFHAFFNSGLTSVTMTDSITSIGPGAFYDSASGRAGGKITQLCGVDANTAPFSSHFFTSLMTSQNDQEQCTEPVCSTGVSGKKWCMDPSCSSPDTTGYAVTGSLALDSFDITATCVAPYVGTASVSECSAHGEAYSLSGCSCGAYTVDGVCTAYRTTCPDNEYIGTDGTATSDHSCIPCAADEKSTGGAACKKLDCLTTTEQGHKNIDIGVDSGDYTVNFS